MPHAAFRSLLCYSLPTVLQDNKSKGQMIPLMNTKLEMSVMAGTSRHLYFSSKQHVCMRGHFVMMSIATVVLYPGRSPG